MTDTAQRAIDLHRLWAGVNFVWKAQNVMPWGSIADDIIIDSIAAKTAARCGGTA